MSALNNVKISTKMFWVVGFAVVGFAAFALFAYSTLGTVKVNGPLYQRIVQGKDVIADILPPPEYILEANLVVYQMADAVETGDKAQLDALIQKGKSLREDYETRHAFWVKDLPEDRMKQTLIQNSYRPAVDFFDLRDKEFIPA